VEGETKMKLQVRPIFFLFLVLGPLAFGPFVVIPFLMVQPINVTFRAAWKKSPAWIWRMAVVASVLLSFDQRGFGCVDRLFSGGCRIDIPYDGVSEAPSGIGAR